MGGLAAVCCHFNPCHYARRLRNCHRFLRSFGPARVPLLTVELAFGDDPFELAEARDVLQIRGGDVMWQKERLLQVGAERLLDEGYEKIVFLDADVEFETAAWPRIVDRALEDAPAVQCFSTVRTDSGGRARAHHGAVKHFLECGELSPWHGVAWALAAEVVEAPGLYQHCIVGSGDSALMVAILGLAHASDAWETTLRHRAFLRHAGPAMVSHYQDWARRLVAVTGGTVVYADMTLDLMSHGTLENRQYVERHRLLEGFDPTREVTYDVAAPLRWTPAGEARREPVASYFRTRDEDGA
jgi:hypothetical protein